MNDMIPGDTFRKIIGKLQHENSELIEMYKNAVTFLAASALLNVALLAFWLWATIGG